MRSGARCPDVLFLSDSHPALERARLLGCVVPVPHGDRLSLQASKTHARFRAPRPPCDQEFVAEQTGCRHTPWFDEFRDTVGAPLGPSRRAAAVQVWTPARPDTGDEP